MASKNKTDLSNDKNASFPNNTSGAITPTLLRNQQQDVIDSMVVLDNGATTQTVLSLVNFAGGIQTAYAQGQGYITGSALNTTFSATTTPTLVNFGTAFLADIQERFTISTAGRFTYTGAETKQLMIDCTIFASVTGGTAKQYIYYIAKNGTIITSSMSKAQYDGSAPDANSCTSNISMAQNDYFELWVEALTATTDLNVDTASIKVFGL